MQGSRRRRIAVTALAVGALLWAGYADIARRVRLVSPSSTALLEDRQGRFLSEGNGASTGGIGYWSLPDALPERVEAAFLALEDRRFYQHSGVDARAVARALWNNLSTNRRQGASTIAMQVARMQDDGEAGGRRTYWKKLRESVVACLLIRQFGHAAVLRHYLRIVPQGNRIHGAAYAARRYFRKPLQDVSWAEAAVLAALPNAPGAMNLFRQEGRQQAVARAGLALRQLHASGALDDQALKIAVRQLESLGIPEKEERPADSYHAILRLEELLAQSPPRDVTRPVRSSLNSDMQRRVTDIADAAILHYRASGAGNIAVIVAEKTTGKVVAYVGSRRYYEPEYAGSINYARVRRSSGSTLKPFIYALGLERGLFTPASLLADTPVFVPLPGGFHRIGNYDGQNLGPLLYRYALANSRNVPAVHVLSRVGLEEAHELFRQLGLTSPGRTGAYYGVGMAIGTLYVTLEDLVAAYGVLANDGRAFRLRWFDADAPERNPAQWMSADAARQISLFLSDPLARLPVFSRMGPLEYPFPAAVKTGTSQGFRDAWAVAYSAHYITGVWLGHPDHTRMREISGLAAAQVAKEIMLWLHPQERRGIAEQPFPAPEGYHAVTLCASTGRPATDDRPRVVEEYFPPGREPDTNAPVFSAQFPNADPSITPGRSVMGSIGAVFPLFSYEHLLNAGITIREPRQGAIFLIEADTPRSMQTLALKADAFPRVAQVVWHVDGQPVANVSYPYRARWPLATGTHAIQARFAHADVTSDIVTITVR